MRPMRIRWSQGRRNKGNLRTPLLKTPMNRPESEPRAAVVNVVVSSLFFRRWLSSVALLASLFLQMAVGRRRAASAPRARSVAVRLDGAGWAQASRRQRFYAAVIAVQGVGPLDRSERCLVICCP